MAEVPESPESAHVRMRLELERLRRTAAQWEARARKAELEVRDLKAELKRYEGID